LYAINYSSLVAVVEIAPTFKQGVLDGLTNLVVSNHLRTVSLAWDSVKEDEIYDGLDGCKRHLIVKERDLYDDLRDVIHLCQFILGDDPTNDSPDPWLLALARRDAAALVTETNALSELPRACTTLNIPLMNLDEMLTAEGIPH
jgi:hypothetical protein